MAYSIPDDLLYTKDHEWVRVDGRFAVIGITDFAQAQLGDIVYLELPEEDEEIIKGDPVGAVESTKAVSDVFAPVSGTVTEVNSPLVDGPEVLNSDQYDEGWLIKVELNDPAELDDLLTPAAYREHCEASE